MAYSLIYFAYSLGNAPYYWPEQAPVIESIQQQFSELEKCEPTDHESAIAVRVEVAPTGVVNTAAINIEMDHSCLVTQVQSWVFPKHKEQLAFVHFSVVAREGKYYLLPGGYVEQLHVGQRYWMRHPNKMPQAASDPLQELPQPEESTIQ